MSFAARPGWKGGPLALFAVLLSGWVGGRIMLWENPFPGEAAASQMRVSVASGRGSGAGGGAAVSSIALTSVMEPENTAGLPVPTTAIPPRRVLPAAPHVPFRLAQAPGLAPTEPPLAAAFPGSAPPGAVPVPAAPIRPGLPSTAAVPPRSDRWSLDAWGFYRQGSDAAPIPQGRVPIYGASQIGAIAQFRAAPHVAADPRLYVRAYRAMIERGESEVSFGGSLRPVRAVPLRAFAELRYTQTPLASDWRPSAFIVTELPPQALPAQFQFEAYGQAGWVGGGFATAFADGQANLVREVASFGAPGGVPVRLSAGAGAWGGAQKDAARVDVGPTVRLEWMMGQVPARLSVDWREQVGGDAAPQSGIAATLSTSF